VAILYFLLYQKFVLFLTYGTTLESQFYSKKNILNLDLDEVPGGRIGKQTAKTITIIPRKYELFTNTGCTKSLIIN